MLNTLNALINIRDFLNAYINNLSIQILPEQSNAIIKKIDEINKTVLNLSLLLDLNKICSSVYGEKYQAKSTYEINTLEELDKFNSENNK